MAVRLHRNGIVDRLKNSLDGDIAVRHDKAVVGNGHAAAEHLPLLEYIPGIGGGGQGDGVVHVRGSGGGAGGAVAVRLHCDAVACPLKNGLDGHVLGRHEKAVVDNGHAAAEHLPLLEHIPGIGGGGQGDGIVHVRGSGGGAGGAVAVCLHRDIIGGVQRQHQPVVGVAYDPVLGSVRMEVSGIVGIDGGGENRLGILFGRDPDVGICRQLERREAFAVRQVQVAVGVVENAQPARKRNIAVFQKVRNVDRTVAPGRVGAGGVAGDLGGAQCGFAVFADINGAAVEGGAVAGDLYRLAVDLQQAGIVAAAGRIDSGHLALVIGNAAAGDGKADRLGGIVGSVAGKVNGAFADGAFVFGDGAAGHFHGGIAQKDGRAARQGVFGGNAVVGNGAAAHGDRGTVHSGDAAAAHVRTADSVLTEDVAGNAAAGQVQLGIAVQIHAAAF